MAIPGPCGGGLGQQLRRTAENDLRAEARKAAAHSNAQRGCAGCRRDGERDAVPGFSLIAATDCRGPAGSFADRAAPGMGCSAVPSPAFSTGQAGGLREQIRRAGMRAAQDDAFRAEGLEGDAGVLERFALFDAGGKRADQGGVCAEGLRRQFKGGAGARARFVEEQRDAALGQPMDARRRDLLFRVASAELGFGNFGDREVAGGDR